MTKDLALKARQLADDIANTKKAIDATAEETGFRVIPKQLVTQWDKVANALNAAADETARFAAAQQKVQEAIQVE